MKQFLQKLGWFVLPMLLFLIVAEVYVSSIPSALKTSTEYFKANKENIDLLVLGSSHMQNAINPEHLTSFNAANLASGGQDLMMDSAIYFAFAGKMPALEYLVFEVSYHGVEHVNEADFAKKDLYYRYLGIDMGGSPFDVGRYSVFLSNPMLYIRTFNIFKSFGVINKYGYQTEISDFEDVNNRFRNLGYDTTKIDTDRDNIFIVGHKKQDIDAFERNKLIVVSLLKDCFKRGTTPIVMLPPVYKSYYEEMVPEKKERRDTFLDSLKQLYPQLVVLDYEMEHGLDLRAFTNEDHLSPAGAMVFTKRLDSLIRANNW